MWRLTTYLLFPLLVLGVVSHLEAATATTSTTDISSSVTASSYLPLSSESESRFPLVQAFRSDESDGSANSTSIIDTLGYMGAASVAKYEYVHFRSNDPYYKHLLKVEAARGDDVTTIMHSQNSGIGIQRIDDLNGNDVYDETNDKVYPGHWLFLVGATATKNILSTDTTIKVSDVSNFSKNDQLMITYWDKASNSRLWDRFEEIIVEEVDEVNQKIKVSRGQNYGNNPTKARNWRTDTEANQNYEIYLTTHATFNDEDGWFLNVSTESPTDPNTGKNGWEFFLDDYFNNIWKKRGVDESAKVEVDGMVFDGGRWIFTNNAAKKLDVNNDRVADFGFIHGKNVLGTGIMQWISELRLLLPDKNIMIDSSTVDMGYRGWGMGINGMEDENFLHEGQSFSEAYTHLKNWLSQTPQEYTPLSYGVTKEDTKLYQCADYKNEFDKPQSNSAFRIGLGVATLLSTHHAYALETENSVAADGAIHRCYDTYRWDEYFGGDLNDWDWLGKPLTVALQKTADMGSENLLLSTATWDVKITSGLESDYEASLDSVSTTTKKLLVKKVPATTKISGTNYYPSVGGAYIRIYDGITPTVDEDFTLRFSAKGTSENSGVARLARAEIITTSDKKYTQQFLVPEKNSAFILSFHLDAADSIKKIQFASGEETGSLTVSNVRLNTGDANLWVRYFEGGAVIVNGTHSEQRIVLSTSYSVKGYSRLKGEYDPSVNTGKDGQGTSTNIFFVPAEDALFVKKKS